MAHRLIIGRTLSGKSALAKQIGSQLRLAGAEVLAFNPTLERGYSRMDDFGCCAAEWETDDFEELADEISRRYKQERKGRVLLLDEAHELPSEMNWLTTKGRHYGLQIIAISQRGAALHPTFRTQIGTWYVFNCAGLDMDMVERETGIKIPKTKKTETDLDGVEHSYYVCNLKKFEYLKITIDGVERKSLFQK